MEKFVKIRIDEETKEKFFKKCDKESINPSKLIRNYILKWIEESEN